MINDPIADMLARINNALQAGHSTVSMPSTKVLVPVAKIMQEEGFLLGVEVIPEKPQPVLKLRLKYVGRRRDRRSVIRGMKRVSKPGRRVYTKRTEIPWVQSGMGVAVLSTPKGVMTDQDARRQQVGGEVLCYVW